MASVLSTIATLLCHFVRLYLGLLLLSGFTLWKLQQREKDKTVGGAYSAIFMLLALFILPAVSVVVLGLIYVVIGE